MGGLAVRIEEGPRRGEVVAFDEPGTFIVGRDGPACRAHLRLDPGDRYVSQNHLVLEIRPPSCHLRDLGSRNGTEIRRAGESAWSRVEEAMLDDGDRVRVGNTVLCIEHTAGAVAADLRCIRCLGPLTDGSGAVAAARSYRDVDFMCRGCRDAVDAERSLGPARTHACGGGCGIDVSAEADADGRAAELADVADYLCEACAERQRQLARTYIGDYLLLAEVGSGGMGIVYRVRHRVTGRVAALKQLLRPLAVPPATLQRFRREIALLQQLTHDRVTRLFEAGEDDDAPYFVSEFVPDGHVGQFVSDDGTPLLEPEAAARLIGDALVGVAAVHERGVVHRDLKPENILLLRRDGALVPKVADFGLARSYEVHGGTVSQTGEFGGTFAYLPPEQVRDFRGSTPTVDVYAAGVCLYYLLTGRYPLDFPTPWQLRHGSGLARQGALPANPVRLALAGTRTPVLRRRADLPPGLAAIVDRAVAPDPQHRIQTAGQLRLELLEVVGAAP